ncbi:MAG: hypothetical protein FJ100_17830 [Deltaproteobacteria bacterium]|nr:hypothetical protein [Deltaproteobacteria bacterium]
MIQETLDQGDLLDHPRLLPFKADLGACGQALTAAVQGRAPKEDPAEDGLLTAAQAADGVFDASVRALRGLFEATPESAEADRKAGDAAAIRAGLASLLPDGAAATGRAWAWEAGEGQRVTERHGRPEVQAALALVVATAPGAPAWIDRVIAAAATLGTAIAALDGHRAAANKTTGLALVRARNDAAHVWKLFLAAVDRTYPAGDERAAANRARLLAAWVERGER